MSVALKASQRAARTVDEMDVRLAVLTAGMSVDAMASLRAALRVVKLDCK